MEKLDFLSKCKEVKLDNQRIREIESFYGVSIPDYVRKHVSYVSDPIFIDETDVKIMYYEEILANGLVDFDFRGLKMIPLIDKGDLDYIVYNFEKGNYQVFNLSDEDYYLESNQIEKLL